MFGTSVWMDGNSGWVTLPLFVIFHPSNHSLLMATLSNKLVVLDLVAVLQKKMEAVRPLKTQNWKFQTVTFTILCESKKVPGQLGF